MKPRGRILCPSSHPATGYIAFSFSTETIGYLFHFSHISANCWRGRNVSEVRRPAVRFRPQGSRACPPSSAFVRGPRLSPPNTHTLICHPSFLWRVLAGMAASNRFRRTFVTLSLHRFRALFFLPLSLPSIIHLLAAKLCKGRLVAAVHLHCQREGPSHYAIITIFLVSHKA